MRIMVRKLALSSLALSLTTGIITGLYVINNLEKEKLAISIETKITNDRIAAIKQVLLAMAEEREKIMAKEVRKPD